MLIDILINGLFIPEVLITSCTSVILAFIQCHSWYSLIRIILNHTFSLLQNESKNEKKSIKVDESTLVLQLEMIIEWSVYPFHTF